MDTADNISLTITTESLRLLLNMNVPIPTWCMAPIPITPELEEMMRSKVGGRLAQTCRSLRDEAGHHDLRAVWQKVVGEEEGDSPSRRGRVRAGAGLAGGAAVREREAQTEEEEEGEVRCSDWQLSRATGFSEAQCKEALLASDSDIGGATEWLLENRREMVCKIFYNRSFKKRPGISVNGKPVFRNKENYHMWFQKNEIFKDGRWYIKGDWLPTYCALAGEYRVKHDITEQEYKETTLISCYSVQKEMVVGENEFMIAVQRADIPDGWFSISVDVQNLNTLGTLDTESAVALAREIFAGAAGAAGAATVRVREEKAPGAVGDEAGVQREEIRAKAAAAAEERKKARERSLQEELKMKVSAEIATKGEIEEFLTSVGIAFDDTPNKGGKSSGCSMGRQSSGKGGCAARGGANTKRVKKSKKSKKSKKFKRVKKSKKSKRYKRRKNKRSRH